MTKDSKTQPLQSGTLLILGSAPEVVSIADQKLPAGCDLLAVNNAWRVHPETRHVIIPGDFPEKDLPPVERGMNIIRGQQSSRASWNAGGHLFCGTTMVFLAGYFAIWAFKQRQINIFGCNMMYEGKETHFYGLGSPDPLIEDIYTYPGKRNLLAKSVRLFAYGAIQNKLVLNANAQPGSRLFLPPMPNAPLTDEQIEDVMCSETTGCLLSDAIEILKFERKFPGNRYTLDLSVLSRTKEMISFIDQVDDKWEALGHKYYADIEHLLK